MIQHFILASFAGYKEGNALEANWNTCAWEKTIIISGKAKIWMDGQADARSSRKYPPSILIRCSTGNPRLISKFL